MKTSEKIDLWTASSTTTQIEVAKTHVIAESHWREDKYDPDRDWIDDLTTREIVRGVHLTYPEGWPQFLRDYCGEIESHDKQAVAS